MSFSIGDKVRIKSWDKMISEFGHLSNGNIPSNPYFVKRMKHLCGRTATISDIDGKRIKLGAWSDESGIISWQFSLDMVEMVENEEFNLTINGTNLEFINGELFMDGKKYVEHKKEEIDWNCVEIDTPILVSDYKTSIENYEPRHFAKFENGKVYAWVNGRTSHTGSDSTFWEYAELAK